MCRSGSPQGDAHCLLAWFDAVSLCWGEANAWAVLLQAGNVSLRSAMLSSWTLSMHLMLAVLHTVSRKLFS